MRRVRRAMRSAAVAGGEPESERVSERRICAVANLHGEPGHRRRRWHSPRPRDPFRLRACLSRPVLCGRRDSRRHLHLELKASHFSHPRPSVPALEMPEWISRNPGSIARTEARTVQYASASHCELVLGFGMCFMIIGDPFMKPRRERGAAVSMRPRIRRSGHEASSERRIWDHNDR